MTDDFLNRADVLAALEDELHSEYSSLAAGAIKRCIARTRALPSATPSHTGGALAVLREHHQWHQDIGTVGFKDDKGEWAEIDMSDGYADSGLAERTAAAIRALATKDQGNE